MFNGIPETTPQVLAAKLSADSDFILLDVREMWEINLARLDDPRLTILPLSRLARERAAALPPALTANPDAEVIVICHHGVRSADVTTWLIQQGFRNVASLRGGLDAYAAQVDPRIGVYQASLLPAVKNKAALRPPFGFYEAKQPLSYSMTNLPFSYRVSPSTLMVESLRMSQIISQWMTLRFLLPVSG
jgi:rhodanese-related sulfurtransferase